MLFKRYRVTFTGKFDSEKDITVIHSNLVKRLQLKPTTLDSLMLGRPVVLKNDLDAETAQRYKAVTEEIGAISIIEEVPGDSDIDEFGLVERRKTPDRRLNTDRRKSFRAEAHQSERRKNHKDRRKKERRRGNSKRNFST